MQRVIHNVARVDNSILGAVQILVIIRQEKKISD